MHTIFVHIHSPCNNCSNQKKIGATSHVSPATVFFSLLKFYAFSLANSFALRTYCKLDMLINRFEKLHSFPKKAVSVSSSLGDSNRGEIGA